MGCAQNLEHAEGVMGCARDLEHARVHSRLLADGEGGHLLRLAEAAAHREATDALHRHHTPLDTG